MTPTLRFYGCSSNWESVRLGDIADRVTRKNKGNETDIPLTISSLDGLVDQRTYFGKTVASKDMSGYYLLKKGEFAYNKSYSVGFDFGSIKRLDHYDLGALSTLYICFALKEGCNSDFFVKYFDSQKWYKAVQAICAEGARNHGLLNVPTTGFFDMELCIPSDKDEQQKIADFLTAYDEKVSLQQQKVEALERRKKGLLQKVFSREIRFKTDDGSEFPEWKTKPFYEVFSILGNNTLSRAELNPDSGLAQNIHYGDVLIKFGAILDVSKESLPYIADEKLVVKQKQNALKNGDIIMADTAEDDTVGKCSEIVGITDEVIFAGLHTIPIRPADGMFALRYLGYYINSTSFHDQLHPLIQGIKVSSISKSALQNSTTVIVPQKAEQQKIADFFSAIDEQIEIEKKRLESMQTIKKGLLQQMFCDGSSEYEEGSR